MAPDLEARRARFQAIAGAPRCSRSRDSSLPTECVAGSRHAHGEAPDRHADAAGAFDAARP